MTTIRADGTKPMFERRHFEWLAYWAGSVPIDAKAANLLADELAKDNPHFPKARFIDRYLQARELFHKGKPCRRTDLCRRSLPPASAGAGCDYAEDHQ